MPTWILPVILALLDPNGPLKAWADVIRIGKDNGMTAVEEQALTDWYTGAIARRKADAGLTDPT